MAERDPLRNWRQIFFWGNLEALIHATSNVAPHIFWFQNGHLQNYNFAHCPVPELIIKQLFKPCAVCTVQLREPCAVLAAPSILSLVVRHLLVSAWSAWVALRTCPVTWPCLPVGPMDVRGWASGAAYGEGDTAMPHLPESLGSCLLCSCVFFGLGFVVISRLLGFCSLVTSVGTCVLFGLVFKSLFCAQFFVAFNTRHFCRVLMLLC